MRNTTLRAVGYRRVSMREQVDGHSLAAQEDNIRQHVQSQGWELVELYTDAGISAKKDSQRPAFNQLLRDAQAGKFDVVVVDKLDRFYRHLKGLLATLEQLNNCQVSFVSVQEKLDFTSVWGKLTLAVLGTLAEVYIDNLRQETRKGKLQRAREGLWNGNPPYGYCRGLCSDCHEVNGPGYCPLVGQPNKGNGKYLVLHPIESEIVRQIYEWYLYNKDSDGGIATHLATYLLDDKGLLPRARGIVGRNAPGPFQRDHIRKILQNPFYTGVLPYYGKQTEGTKSGTSPQMFPGKHPAIISSEDFEEVQALRKQGIGVQRLHHGQTVPREYLLTGILRCGYCGRPMRGSSGSKQKTYYYRDSSRLERLSNCPQCTLKASEIEDAFLAWLRQTLNNKPVLDDLQSHQVNLSLAETRFERARDLFLAGQLDRSGFDSEKERLENAKQHLQKTTCSANIGALNVMQEYASTWDTLIPSQRKRLFRIAAETVYVRDSVLLCVQPANTLLPFTGNGQCCKSGPDGSELLQ